MNKTLNFQIQANFAYLEAQVIAFYVKKLKDKGYDISQLHDEIIINLVKEEIKKENNL